MAITLTQLEEETKEARTKLSAAEKELVNLRIQLEEARAHLKQYKHIAEVSEKNVRESNEAHEREKAILEARQTELAEQLSRSNAECESLAAARDQLDADLSRAREEMNAKIGEFSQQRADLEGQIELSKRRLENTESILAER